MNEAVETMLTESVPDDAVQAQSETLDSILETPVEQPEKPSEPPVANEPGWIKQRINKAVEKAEARIRAEYEAMLAPIRESVLDREADDLVKNGEFRTLERAKEYVRLKNGQSVAAPVEQEVQRDDRGRFAKPQNDPVVQARADLLAAQAQKIHASRGVDVMSAMQNDPDIKTRVLSGEWDFYDVAEHVSQPRKTVPAPVRTPNGSGTGDVSIANMSAEQFRRLQQNLSSGKRYKDRK